ncbi:hypothetical protein NHP190012_13680 [Helicobacter sp. NHP19-012]|uniref:beta-lactamase n=1 Tax=Helicobacter gastrofelis TaxID=2849642 RepID=A0ABN6I7Z1_9HELI|nr:tetratricopeptide repeat protein [Helicobacter sp. NHP19-012]BCZ19726.1 hypothetical protein NHP190012_13680 [Helicobacter sp. NHP19-012]
MGEFLKVSSRMVLLALLCLSGVYANEKADRYLRVGLEAHKHKNYLRALRNFQEAAKLGDAKASYNLGLMYKKGEGVSKKNYLRALQYFHKAGDLGDARGYYNLAVMYKYGTGVARDARMARYYFQKACDLDRQDGCRDVEGSEPYQDQKMGSAKKSSGWFQSIFQED